MKETDKKANAEQEKIASKKSYEPDPTLKELASSLQDKSSALRREKGVQALDLIFHLEKLYPSSKDISAFAKAADNLPELKEDFKESLGKIASTFRKSLASMKDIEEINHQLQELIVENFFQAARALAIAVEAKDPYTGGHSERVFEIACELGKRCSISTTEQLYLAGGALLHDVGKIGIRDSVLLKPGPLTDSEYKEMQLHTIIGAQIVQRMNCLLGCIDAVLFHHERIDGYGYPYGIKGKEIPLIARIISIADAYDAMTTNRVYRKALSHEQAFEEILRNTGTQFDPDLVHIFTKWWDDIHQVKTGERKAQANVYQCKRRTHLQNQAVEQ